MTTSLGAPAVPRVRFAETDFQTIDSRRIDQAAHDAWTDWAAGRWPFSRYAPAGMDARHAMDIALGLMRDKAYPAIGAMHLTRLGEPDSLGERNEVRAILDRVEDAQELGDLFALVLVFARVTLEKITRHHLEVRRERAIERLRSAPYVAPRTILRQVVREIEVPVVKRITLNRDPDGSLLSFTETERLDRGNRNGKPTA